jgi:hypothetical protein
MKPDVRDRLVLPLLIPLGLLGVLAAIAVGFGMLLLFNPMTISLMIAIVVSAGILAAFGMESAARPEEQTRPKRAVISLAIVAPLALGLLVAVDIIPVDARKMVDVEPFLAIPEDAPVVVARDLLFGLMDPETGEVDMDEQDFELPAEQDVAVVLINEDAGIDHDIWIYPIEDDEAQLDDPFFQGETFPGVGQRVYTFESPEAGTYFYNCSVHPGTMTGHIEFVDEPEEG